MWAPTYVLERYSSPSEWQKLQIPLEERSKDYYKVDERLRRYEADPELLARHKRAVYNFGVCRNMLSLGDFLYFGGGPSAPILYFNSPSPLISSSPIYERLPVTSLRRLVNACAPDLLEPKQVRDIIETFLDIPDPNQQIERRVIAISSSLYWDRKTASLMTDPAPHRCFYRLFDTREAEKNVPSFPPSTFGESFSKDVQSSYRSLLSVLNSLPDHTFPKNPTPVSHPTLPYSFPFILDWADGSHGLYWDLMKILATTFFDKRPDVAYFLMGTGSNGKSSICSSVKIIVKRDDKIIKATQGTLRRGDYVLTPKGEWAKVIDPMVNPTSSSPCYRVTLQDGRSVVATDDHIWTVVPERRLVDKRQHIPLTGYDPEMWETRRTDELLADLSAPEPRYWYLPPTAPAPFPERFLPIEPYTLGVILRDGDISQPGQVRIDGSDPELIEAVTHSPAKVSKYETRLSPNKIINYHGSTSIYASNLAALGLAGKKSHEKFIPPEYLVASISQRKALLAALLDTDGYINPATRQAEFSTTSRQLADDFKELVFSLGGTATESSRMGSCITPDGKKRQTRVNYRIMVRTPFSPFSLPCKASLWKKPKRLGYVRIKSIERIPSVPCNCIAVEDPEASPENQHTYLVGDYIPTHNCFVGLAHTIFGSANTSRVPLSQIGDTHLTNSLRFSLLNAPDDEGGNKQRDDINQYTKVFKQLASHETLTLPVMYSQVPVDLKADFMCILPMNMFPRWSGSDVSALTRRTVLVPFTHDFRAHSVHHDNFASETYTPEVLASLVGQLLALATFYKDTPLTYSSVIDTTAKQAELENDTPRVYSKLFERYFNGFQSKKTLYNDYVNWVKANEAGTIVPMNNFRIYWERYLSLPKSKRVRPRFTGVDGETKRPSVYRIETPLPHFLMADEMPLSKLGVRHPDFYGGTVREAVGRGFSVVDILERQNEGE